MSGSDVSVQDPRASGRGFKALPDSDQAPFYVFFFGPGMKVIESGIYGTWRATQRAVAFNEAQEIADREGHPVGVFVQGRARGRCHRQFVAIPTADLLADLNAAYCAAQLTRHGRASR